MAETILEEDHMDHPLLNKQLGRLLDMEDMYYRRIIGVKELNELFLIYAVIFF